MSRLLNPAVYEGKFFLSRTPLWQWQINDYAVVMIVWNGLLALLPVVLGLLLARSIRTKRPWWEIIPLGIFWILFVPNTAYLIADVRHIIGYCPLTEYGRVCADNAWMTVFFFVYGVLGWVALVWGLRPTRSAVTQRWGANVSLIGTLAALPLIALGFLLGLVNRWNSWDVINDPWGVLLSAYQYISNLTYLKNWIIVSVLLIVLYFVGERLFKTFKWETK